jgi:hypothetical protein
MIQRSTILAVIIYACSCGLGLGADNTWVISAFVNTTPNGEPKDARLHVKCLDNEQSNAYFANTAEYNNGRLCNITYWPGRNEVKENASGIPPNEVTQVPTSAYTNELRRRIEELEGSNKKLLRQNTELQNTLNNLPNAVLEATFKPALEQIVKNIIVQCASDLRKCNQ